LALRVSKRQFLLNDLKLHGAIDYKAGPVGPQLAALAPNGIDVYFDNVGGETLDAVVTDQPARPDHPVRWYFTTATWTTSAARGRTDLQMIAKCHQGFTMRDIDRVPEAFMSLMQMQASGEIIFREHIVKGIDTFPEAFTTLFAGKNEGKLIEI